MIVISDDEWGMFTNQSNLRRHMTKVHKWTCYVCTSHKLYHRENLKRTFLCNMPNWHQCRQCAGVFTLRNNLKRHQTTVHGATRYICSVSAWLAFTSTEMIYRKNQFKKARYRHRRQHAVCSVASAHWFSQRAICSKWTQRGTFYHGDPWSNKRNDTCAILFSGPPFHHFTSVLKLISRLCKSRF